MALGVSPKKSSLASLGWPVYVTPFIAENETNGSGTNQSHIIFANPKYLHVGTSDNFEILLSTERYFENNQTAIRGIHRHDLAVGPAAGVVVLKGVN